MIGNSNLDQEPPKITFLEYIWTKYSTPPGDDFLDQVQVCGMSFRRLNSEESFPRLKKGYPETPNPITYFALEVKKVDNDLDPYSKPDPNDVGVLSARQFLIPERRAKQNEIGVLHNAMGEEEMEFDAANEENPPIQESFVSETTRILNQDPITDRNPERGLRRCAELSMSYSEPIEKKSERFYAHAYVQTLDWCNKPEKSLDATGSPRVPFFFLQKGLDSKLKKLKSFVFQSILPFQYSSSQIVFGVSCIMLLILFGRAIQIIYRISFKEKMV